ncbi:hypothetical protein [Paraliobacillus zengyii]|uniref:hypothetical protein n=1 Tax=Paraliobacillus zengyii TaxID=2213194 RepID=UPI0013A6A6B3|nr:hypothetical protein [Paraliobacillus zengyii]
MKIVWESLRFILIFTILMLILGFITDLILLMIGLTAEIYRSIAIIAAFIITCLLYKKKGWGKKYNKLILLITFILIVLFTVVIPDMSPTHLHTWKYAYSYGFPFHFFTLYSENGATFIIPNLFSKGRIIWDAQIFLIYLNFIIIYFTIHFLFKYVNRRK